MINWSQIFQAINIIKNNVFNLISKEEIIEELKNLREMLQIGKVSDQYVEYMNQTDYPLQNIYSWIHAKSAEMFELSKLRIKEQYIFKCQYENKSEQQLHDAVNLLEPLRMILTHPNLSSLYKNNLQCLKKTVDFNSEDILAISKPEPVVTVPSYFK